MAPSTGRERLISSCHHIGADTLSTTFSHPVPSLTKPRQVYCVQHHRDESQPRGIRVELAAVHLEEPDTDIHNGIIFLGLGCFSRRGTVVRSDVMGNLPMTAMLMLASVLLTAGLPAMVSHKINYESPLSPDVPAGTCFVLKIGAFQWSRFAF